METRVRANAFVKAFRILRSVVISVTTFTVFHSQLLFVKCIENYRSFACNALLSGDNSSLFFFLLSKTSAGEKKKKKKNDYARRGEMWKTGSCDKSTITRRAKYKFYPTAMASRVYPFMCVRGLEAQKKKKKIINATLYFGHRPWSPHGTCISGGWRGEVLRARGNRWKRANRCERVQKRSKSLTTRSTVTRNGHCYSFDRSHSFHLRPHAITPAIVIITLRLVCEKFDLDNLELFSSQLQLYTATISGNISWFNKMWSKHRRKNVVICLIFLKIRIFFSLQSTQSLFSSK